MVKLNDKHMRKKLALIEKIQSNMKNPNTRENNEAHTHSNVIPAHSPTDIHTSAQSDHSHTGDSTAQPGSSSANILTQLQDLGTSISTEGIEVAQKVIKHSGDNVEAIVDNTGNIIKTTIDGVGSTVLSAIDEVEGVLGTAIDSVGTTADVLAGAVGETGSHIVESVNTPVNVALDQVDEVASSLFTTVGGTATLLSDEILTQSDTLIDEAGQLTTSLTTNTEDVGSTLLDNTKHIANNFTGNTRNIFNKGFDTLSDANVAAADETKSLFALWLPWIMGLILLSAICYGSYRFSLYLASSNHYDRGYARFRRTRRRSRRPYIEEY